MPSQETGALAVAFHTGACMIVESVEYLRVMKKLVPHLVWLVIAVGAFAVGVKRSGSPGGQGDSANGGGAASPKLSRPDRGTRGGGVAGGGSSINGADSAGARPEVSEGAMKSAVLRMVERLAIRPVPGLSRGSCSSTTMWSAGRRLASTRPLPRLPGIPIGAGC